MATYPAPPSRSSLEGVAAAPHLWWEEVSGTERDAVERLRFGAAESQGEILHIILPAARGVVQQLPAKTRLLGPQQQRQQETNPGQV